MAAWTSVSVWSRAAVGVGRGVHSRRGGPIGERFRVPQRAFLARAARLVLQPFPGARGGCRSRHARQLPVLPSVGQRVGTGSPEPRRFSHGAAGSSGRFGCGCYLQALQKKSGRSITIQINLVIAQLATWDGGAQRIEHSCQIDELLKNGATYWGEPAEPKAMNIPTTLSAIPPTALCSAIRRMRRAR